jgi:hypothetical protein
MVGIMFRFFEGFTTATRDDGSVTGALVRILGK